MDTQFKKRLRMGVIVERLTRLRKSRSNPKRGLFFLNHE